jgi:hypothetical protein
MSADTRIILGRIFNFAFAVFHLLFWRIFEWKHSLAGLTFINRQIVQILNGCLCVVFLAFTCFSLFYTRELLQTSLGHAMLLFMAGFWFIRMLLQIICFPPSNPLSMFFTLLFLSGSLLYSYPWYLAITSN